MEVVKTMDILSQLRDFEERGNNNVPFKDFLEEAGLTEKDCLLLGNSLLKVGNKTLPISKTFRPIVAKDPSKLGGGYLWNVTATNKETGKEESFWVLGFAPGHRELGKLDFTPVRKAFDLNTTAVV